MATTAAADYALELGAKYFELGDLCFDGLQLPRGDPISFAAIAVGLIQEMSKDLISAISKPSPRACRTKFNRWSCPVV